jgi:glycerophosphoryl diester phosphodiesterase
VLGDVAALVPERCRILVDLKEKRPDRCARLVAALADALPDRERFRICGGRPADLDAVRAAGFRTWRTVRNPGELRTVLAADRLPDEAVSVRHTVLTSGVVGELHERVGTVVAWTVNSPARARQLAAMGVDGVTTDRSAVLRAMAART